MEGFSFFSLSMPDHDGEASPGGPTAAAAEASKPSLPPLMLARLAARGIVKPTGRGASGGSGGDRIASTST